MSKPADQPPEWRSRIVGYGVEVPDQCLANPRNWRIHPQRQQKALEAILDRVGWVRDVIVNKQTGHVVDGHLRVGLAISRGETSVPVTYVDMSENEERAVLALHDPLAELAGIDEDAFRELVAAAGADELAQLLADARDEKPAADGGDSAGGSDTVLAICPSCLHEWPVKVR